MIVKNEDKNLKRALSWGKDLFDEQIVVDTGSDDGTVPLAVQMGANVIHFKWIDDFSAARNFALAHCTGDWIFFLDADEYFKEADVPHLRSLVESVSGCSENTDGNPQNYNVIETPWINEEDHSVARQARIFRNVPYLRYVGALHEQIQAMPGGYRKVYSVVESPAIYHTGYMWSVSDAKAEKGARNFEIARKALEKDADSAKMQLFAAEALMHQKKYDEAEGYFFEAMKNGDGSIWPERMQEGYKQWLTIYLRMENFKPQAANILGKALHVHAESTARFPDDPDFDVLLSMLFFKAKDLQSTVRFFNASLMKNNGRLTGSLIDSDAYKRLRALCEQLSKFM